VIRGYRLHLFFEESASLYQREAIDGETLTGLDAAAAKDWRLRHRHIGPKDISGYAKSAPSSAFFSSVEEAGKAAALELARMEELKSVRGIEFRVEPIGNIGFKITPRIEVEVEESID
jgi:hypothetical protein